MIEYESKTSVDFSKIWLVRSESADTNENMLPYVVHFDKERYLKALIYLVNVPLDCGPIHFAKAKAPEEIEKKRRILPNEYQKKKLNWLCKNDLLDQPVPVVGEAGDLILFDTNTPHHAGIVKPNNVRLALRIDYKQIN